MSNRDNYPYRLGKPKVEEYTHSNYRADECAYCKRTVLECGTYNDEYNELSKASGMCKRYCEWCLVQLSTNNEGHENPDALREYNRAVEKFELENNKYSGISIAQLYAITRKY